MRALTASALAFLLAAAPAGAVLAASEAPVAAATVALEPVALPIIVDGKLLNYVFCSVRLDLFPGADGGRVRAKEQYFRDDLVRAGHRAPFVRMDDYNHVDEARVRAELMRFAPSVVGANVVRAAVVTRQTPQKLLAPPVAQRSGSHEITP